MQKYIMDLKKEKSIVKIVRNNSKTWQIGRWFFYGTVILTSYIMIDNAIIGINHLRKGGEIDAYIIYVLGVGLLPFCLTLVTYLLAIREGRDILLARNNDTIYLEQQQLKNTFIPRFKRVVRADYVEICIEYSAITSMVWNMPLCRLELEGEYSRLLFNNDIAAEDRAKPKKIMLYDCYEEMDTIIKHLEAKTGLKVQGSELKT